MPDSEGLFVDGARSPILALLGCNKLRLRLFPLTALLRVAVGSALDRIFNLNALLNPEEDVFHLRDLVLHQVFMKGVGTCSPMMNVVAATFSLQLYT